MRAKNCTQSDLELALRAVNSQYNGNITWNRFERKGRQFHFTLRCRSSKELGHRRGYSGTRLISACWHVHGNFFEHLFSLNPETKVLSQGRWITKANGNWQDRNIGSTLRPWYFSEACDC